MSRKGDGRKCLPDVRVSKGISLKQKKKKKKKKKMMMMMMMMMICSSVFLFLSVSLSVCACFLCVFFDVQEQSREAEKAPKKAILVILEILAFI